MPVLYMKKIIEVCLCAVLTLGLTVLSQAALLLEDGFNYPTGALTNWSGLNILIQVTSPGLSLDGVPDTTPSGNKVSVVPDGTTTGKVQNKSFTPVTNGTVYCGFLIKCTSLPTTSTYVIGVVTNNSPGVSGSPDPMVLYVVNVTGGYQFRIRHTGTSQISATNVFDVGTPHFLVMKYTFGNTGRADLFVDPSPIGTEPAIPSATASTGGTDAPDLSQVSIKAQSATTQGNWDVDTIRVGTTWADVTTASAVVSPIPLSYQKSENNLILSWSDASFALQSSPAVTGGFSTIQSATSPYPNSITGTGKYFRLIHP
jgi:hypothetical protein